VRVRVGGRGLRYRPRSVDAVHVRGRLWRVVVRGRMRRVRVGLKRRVLHAHRSGLENVTFATSVILSRGKKKPMCTCLRYGFPYVADILGSVTFSAPFGRVLVAYIGESMPPPGCCMGGFALFALTVTTAYEAGGL
jgi:hypothetical protein